VRCLGQGELRPSRDSTIFKFKEFVVLFDNLKRDVTPSIYELKIIAAQ